MPVPKPFEYYASESVEEALKLLDKYGEDAKVIAGGQSLVPLMKFRIVVPAVLVDIYKNLRRQLNYIKMVRPDEIAIRPSDPLRNSNIRAPQRKMPYPRPHRGPSS